MNIESELRAVVRYARLVSADGIEHDRREYRYGDALELTPREGTWYGLRVWLLDEHGRDLIGIDAPPIYAGQIASLSYD